MGFPEFLRLFCRCWKPSFSGDTSTKDGDPSGRTDGLLWYKDSGCHASGEYSMAVIQANNLLEDHCHLHSSTDMPDKGTFVGVFDGHGGPEASRYVSDHLFNHLKSSSNCIVSILPTTLIRRRVSGFCSENGGMSSEVIRRSYMATEEGFLAQVRDHWAVKPQMASVGTCCLVGILSNGCLYVANAGDSRAVLGRVDRTLKDYKAIQLSVEHNASEESVRRELRALHPNDPQIVVLKHKVWRVKGLIQVSRSIGDAYLKRAEFNREPLLPKFRLPRVDAPILRADPAITEHKLCAEDKFVILASDGLWEHVTNEEAVDIVKSSPRNGVARKLLRVALQEAAKKREMRYSDLKKIERGIRRHFHDDITIVVLFIDSHLPA